MFVDLLECVRSASDYCRMKVFICVFINCLGAKARSNTLQLFNTIELDRWYLEQTRKHMYCKLSTRGCCTKGKRAALLVADDHAIVHWSISAGCLWPFDSKEPVARLLVAIWQQGTCSSLHHCVALLHFLGQPFAVCFSSISGVSLQRQPHWWLPYGPHLTRGVGREKKSTATCIGGETLCDLSNSCALSNTCLSCDSISVLPAAREILLSYHVVSACCNLAPPKSLPKCYLHANLMNTAMEQH